VARAGFVEFVRAVVENARRTQALRKDSPEKDGGSGMRVTDFIHGNSRIRAKRLKQWRQKVIFVVNMYEHDVEEKLPAVQPEIEGHFTVIDNFQELEKYRDSIDPEELELFGERFEKHHDHLLAFIHQQKIAAFGWFTVSRKFYIEPEGRHIIPIPEEASFIYDGQTMREFRKKSIYSAKMSLLPEILKRYKKKRYFFIVYTHNQPVMKAIKKLGYKRIRKYLYISVKNIHLHFRIR
jgi:hypothetical protein